MLYEKLTEITGMKNVKRFIAAMPGENELKRIRKNFDNEMIAEKISILNESLQLNLKYIQPSEYDANEYAGNIENPIGVSHTPIGLIGPLAIQGNNAKGKFYVPMATTEGALISTYDLGARLLQMSEPIKTEILNNIVHITSMFPFANPNDSETIQEFVTTNYKKIKSIAEKDSKHTTLLDIEQYIVKDNHLLKFKYDTSDAQGLNMINNATFQACQFISENVKLDFYHRSHFSGVKHNSPMNHKEGYGRRVKASVVISKKALDRLGVSARALKDFFDRCITCASAAGITHINVHAANAIAAIYMATGQDMADLSSSTVCSSRTELVNRAQDLYWEVEIPNLLIATVGGGTSLFTQKECLSLMEAHGSGKADKLAEIIAATVLAGEFPTAAAVVNKTYVQAHKKYTVKDK
ncbi:MAG: hypothetical protein NE327_19605 [Lentisphaeraceae bacterium]|nr:hypothetical protein [Lentisphaeraceae bacterium]